MNKMRLLGAAVACAFALSATPALAWNGKGHMMVAAVAWKNMSPEAQREATRLIKLNPNYNKWVAGISAADRDLTAFVRAATWPDEIKSGVGYSDAGPNHPEAGQNIGYADKWKHRYWHYKDIGFSQDGTAFRDQDPPNAITAISMFTAALGATNSSDDVKSYDLAWLMHLVGDIHQPLHATERFSADLLDGDNGGNYTMVCLPHVSVELCKDRSGPLHSFWDGAMGSTKHARIAIQAGNALGTPRGDVTITSPEAWLMESSALAQTRVYVSPIGPAGGAHRLTDRYRLNAETLAREQMALGGVRLGKLLTELLG